MSRAVALIDGEHYPPVVRFALEALGTDIDVVAAVFLGGTEKVDLEKGTDAYGVPMVWGDSAEAAIREAIDAHKPDFVVDLSDEPVVTAADRFRLAGVALEMGVGYRGADFEFRPPRLSVVTRTPTLGIIGTGKRVGKTAISAHVGRRLKATGVDVAVLAMGRGGPEEPELIRGDEVALTTEDLLELVALGKHASSDNYEDAVMSRVTTVGCRRCGGGMAGDTFFSNVPEGVELADSLGKELLVIEGSGAAIPPVSRDATILVVSADRGVSYVKDYFGPYRVQLADLVVLANAEEPSADPHDVSAVRDAIGELRPDLPVVATAFRPTPIAPVEGARVFFATTAPPQVLSQLTSHLEQVHGCDVVGASAHLADRSKLRQDMLSVQGGFDLLLTELKAAAIDVVAAAGADAGVPTVLCDNVPETVDGGDLDASIDEVADSAIARGLERG